MGRPQIILTSTNKTASFKVFVVCGWREEAVAGVCLRTYLVHSTFVFLVMYQGYESRKNCKPSCTFIAVLSFERDTYLLLSWCIIVCMMLSFLLSPVTKKLQVTRYRCVPRG